jgi:hypothetical protein
MVKIPRIEVRQRSSTLGGEQAQFVEINLGRISAFDGMQPKFEQVPPISPDPRQDGIDTVLRSANGADMASRTGPR